jgi:hypothetical protein
MNQQQLQTLIKTALRKKSKNDFDRKLGISNFDPDCIIKIRKQISNVN